MMEGHAQHTPGQPCPCQQEFGEAVPWLLLALVVVFLLDRWRARKKKKPEDKKGPTDPENDGDMT